MTAARVRGPTLLAGGVVFAVAIASFMRAPLLPEIGRDLGITAAAVAMITTAFALGRLVMDLPAGRLADRLPPGRALAGSGVGVAVSAALLATAQSLAQALAGVFFLGVASALTNTTGMTLFATSAPSERRGTAMAGFSMALITGQTLGPAIGGTVAELAGWRAAQGVAVLIGVAVFAVCLLVPAGRVARPAHEPAGPDEAVPQRPRPAEGRAPAGPDEAVASRRPDPAARRASPPGLSRSQAAVLAAVPFAVFFAFSALPQTLLPVIGSSELALSTATIGLALGAGGVARIGGSAVTGVISDRVSRKAALVPSLLIMAVAVLAAGAAAGGGDVAARDPAPVRRLVRDRGRRHHHRRPRAGRYGRPPARHVPLHRRLRAARRPGRHRPALPAQRPGGGDAGDRRRAGRLRARGGPADCGA